MNTMIEFDEERYAVPVGSRLTNGNSVHGVRLQSRLHTRLGDIIDYLSDKRDDICKKEAVNVLMCLYHNKKRWRAKYKVLRYALEAEVQHAEGMGDTGTYDLLVHILDATTDENAVMCRKCDSCRQMLTVLAKVEPLIALYRKLTEIEKANPQLHHGLDAIWQEMNDLDESVVLLRQCAGWGKPDEDPHPDPVSESHPYVVASAATQY